MSRSLESCSTDPGLWFSLENQLNATRTRATSIRTNFRHSNQLRAATNIHIRDLRLMLFETTSKSSDEYGEIHEVKFFQSASMTFGTLHAFEKTTTHCSQPETRTSTAIIPKTTKGSSTTWYKKDRVELLCSGIPRDIVCAHWHFVHVPRPEDPMNLSALEA